MSHLVADGYFQNNQNKMSGVRQARIIIADDGIYALDYKISTFWMLLSHQFGLLGMIIFNIFSGKQKKKMQAVFDAKTPQELVSEDATNYFIAYQAIEQFEAKTGFLQNWRGNKKIEVTAQTKFTLLFDKADYESALSLLRSKCGGKEKQK